MKPSGMEYPVGGEGVKLETTLRSGGGMEIFWRHTNFGEQQPKYQWHNAFEMAAANNLFRVLVIRNNMWL